MQLARSIVGTCLGFIALTGSATAASNSAAPSSAAPNSTDTICTTELRQQIEAITNRSEFRSVHWGILIQTLEPSPQTLYAHNADRFFTPASTLKLLTTAAVLSQLGPDFRIQTIVNQLPSSNQAAILQVIGQSDPSLSSKQLQALTTQIAAHGIQHVRQLIGVDFLQQDQINPTWEWEDVQAGYGAAVNGLILNQNAIELSLVPQALGQPLAVQWEESSSERWQIVNRSVTVAPTAAEFVQVGRDLTQPILYVDGQLRVGSAAEPAAIAQLDPSQIFLAQLQQTLQQQHIQVDTTTVATAASLSETEPIAVIDSPPLAQLIQTTNQDSNNLYAEALLRVLGIQNNSTAATLDLWLASAAAALTQLGIDPETYHLADASGLSRHNLVSPIALGQALAAMARSPYAEVYYASLATAGTSGTLADRWRDTEVEGKFHGKTGSLTNIAALSGYLERPNASTWTVSILLNQSSLPASVNQAAIDKIVLALTRLESCQFN